MKLWALAAAAVLYVMTAVDLAWHGQWWMALAFAAYAVANVGFIGATY